MTATEDMAERHARQLARYAELSLSLAEDVHAGALAATDPDQKAGLANGFHKLGRAMRQSIALEARFVRDRAADQRAAQADAADAGRAAVKRRQDQVRAAVERQIYCEVEPHDAPAWLADLSERLEDEALYDDFGDESVEDHIASLAAALGLTGEAAHDYTPRALRPRFPAPRRGAADYEVFGDLPADEDDEEDEDEEDEDDAIEDETSGEDAPADGEGDMPDHSPDDPSGPSPPEREAAPEPEPPSEPPPAEPPPPDPPDPEPYVPPWERHPNGHFPGGSGY